MKRNKVRTTIATSQSNPSVSVVMPVYNVELYVGIAIESILNQTWTDFEFIIIDDGSIDQTWNIVCSYQDKRIIKLQNETNLGNYPSRNKGMSIARGKYIAVMDGDDIAWPERLEKQVRHLESHPDLLAVGCDFTYIAESHRGGIPYHPDEVMFSFLKGYYILHPSLFIRMEVIKALNGYNENYKYAADYDLSCRVALMGSMEILPEILMTYRKHPEQISSGNNKQQMQYAWKIRQWYQVAFINKYRSENQSMVSKQEIGYPGMGTMIGFYTYTRYSGNKYIEQLADDMLEHLFENVSFDDIEKICDVGYGLLYLLRNGLVEGKEDEVLEEVDERVKAAIQEESDPNKKERLLQYVVCRQHAKKEELSL